MAGRLLTEDAPRADEAQDDRDRHGAESAVGFVRGIENRDDIGIGHGRRGRRAAARAVVSVAAGFAVSTDP